jgi:hypothetical protein
MNRTESNRDNEREYRQQRKEEATRIRNEQVSYMRRVVKIEAAQTHAIAAVCRAAICYDLLAQVTAWAGVKMPLIVMARKGTLWK